MSPQTLKELIPANLKEITINLCVDIDHNSLCQTDRVP